MDEEERGIWAPVATIGSGRGGASIRVSTQHQGASTHSAKKYSGSGGPVVDSAMLEKERQTLEKIKWKQVKHSFSYLLVKRN